MTTSHSSKHQYGLWQVGTGSGRYTPESKLTPKENLIQATIIKALTLLYPEAVIYNIGAGAYLRSGLPDIMIGYMGSTLWIEVKRPGADTTKLQKAVLEKFKAVGHGVGTAETVGTALEVMEGYIAWMKARK